VRAIHGDAPYMRLEPDRVYEICLRSTGESSSRPERAWRRRKRNKPTLGAEAQTSGRLSDGR